MAIILISTNYVCFQLTTVAAVTPLSAGDTHLTVTRRLMQLLIRRHLVSCGEVSPWRLLFKAQSPSEPVISPLWERVFK